MNTAAHPALARLGRPSALRIHALEAWFVLHEPTGISPPALDRIDVVP